MKVPSIRIATRRKFVGSIIAGIYGVFIGLLGMGFYDITRPFIRQNLGSTYDLRRLVISFGLLILGVVILIVGLVVVLKNRASLQTWSLRIAPLMLGTGIAIAVGLPLAFSMAWELLSCLLHLYVTHNLNF